MIDMEVGISLKPRDHEIDECLECCLFCLAIERPEPLIARLSAVDVMKAVEVFETVLSNKGITLEIEEDISFIRLG